MKQLTKKIQRYFEFLRHFQNPVLVFCLRQGWLRLPLFLYRLRKNNSDYQLLGRPQANSGSDLFILREVLVEETYRVVLPLVGKEPLRLVDIGANIGAATIWFHRVHGVREAFCFEPDLDSFRLCEFNLERNGCGSAHAFMLAIGSKSRHARMFSDPDRPAQSSLYRKEISKHAVAQDIEVIGFREWLAGNKGDFDVLKCDCEGAEWEILEDSPEVFARFALVVIEVHKDPASRHDVNEFPEVLSRHGFSTVRWDGCANGLYVGTRK